MNDEIKISELKPASFVNGIKRDMAVSYIVKMISRCIKEDKRITVHEIVDCWIDVKLARNVYGVYFYGWQIDGNVGKYMLREEMKEKCRGIIKARAIPWFMNNLGAAIIKGKMLVIPLIDIEEQKQITP